MPKAPSKTKAAKKSAAKKGAAAKRANINVDQLKEDYRMMLLIRRFEEKAGQLYGMGLIGGFCHLYIGQEAVVTGIQGEATGDDGVITSYRDHGHMLACNMDPRGVMAELTGRIGGYSKGKGGSMHMARGKGFLMVSSSPLTRSSYHAGEDFQQLRAARREKLAAE